MKRNNLFEGSDAKKDLLSGILGIENVYEISFKKLKKHLHICEELSNGKKYMDINEIIDELCSVRTELLDSLNDIPTDATSIENITRYFINDELALVNNAILQTKSGNLDWF